MKDVHALAIQDRGCCGCVSVAWRSEHGIQAFGWDWIVSVAF